MVLLSLKEKMGQCSKFQAKKERKNPVKTNCTSTFKTLKVSLLQLLTQLSNPGGKSKPRRLGDFSLKMMEKKVRQIRMVKCLVLEIEVRHLHHQLENF